MPARKLETLERRALVLAALSGENKENLAKEYGISLQRVYQVLKEDTAPDELEYRRRVAELAGR